MTSETKRVVVTGGAGFIGSHLSDRLVREGFQVIILDNLATGSIKNIEHLLKRDTVSFVQGSITDLPLLQKLFKNVQYVFHQAALPSVPRSIADPLASHDVNVNGTLNVLLAARDNGVSKVICASSSSVYGDTPTLPKKEDMPPNPKSPYAVTKLVGEYYGKVFCQVYGLSTVSLRYFNVYGPRQNPKSQYAAVIPRFISAALAGKPPVIYGDGEQTRDFTFIRDVVEANFLAAISEATGVFNIARGERITVNRLAQLIISLCGNDVELVHEAERPGDVRDSLADISRARAFGYSPGFSLEEGLKETVRSFKDKT